MQTVIFQCGRSRFSIKWTVLHVEVCKSHKFLVSGDKKAHKNSKMIGPPRTSIRFASFFQTR